VPDYATGATVVVTAPHLPAMVVSPPSTPGVIVTVLRGPQGPAGPAGANGVTEYHGLGPPPLTILGSHPGDLYIDDLTGDRYQQM